MLRKPLIQWTYDRVMKARNITSVVVAIPDTADEDKLDCQLRDAGIPVYRGHATDVLSRYYHAAINLSASTVVRVTGDCPLIDAELIDMCVNEFENETAGYVRLSVGENKESAFPRGLDVEVFSFNSLKDAHENAREPYEREHVTPYLYTGQRQNVTSIVPSDEFDRPSYRWCIDTERDFSMFSRLTEVVGKDLLDMSARDLITILNDHPEIVELNAT